MRGLGVRGITPNARERTAIPDGGAPARPGLARRDFASPVPACKPVGDITHLKTGRGWLFLSTVVDLNARMVAGRSLSARMTAGIAAGAPEAAGSRGYVAENAIFRSGRGAQHASRPLAKWAAGHRVGLSVGRTGSCHGNAVAEPFFATLKDEMRRTRPLATRDEARRAAIECIEPCYNRERPHPTIGYRVPAEAMDAFSERTKDAVQVAAMASEEPVGKAA